MHGIVHKTLKEYVVTHTDDDTWDTVVEQARVEPTLYLPVSHYDDTEIDAVLESLAAMATQSRRQIERDFGRTLAPELVSTFSAHVRSDWGLVDLLVRLEEITAAVEEATDETALPNLSCRFDDDAETDVEPAEVDAGECDELFVTYRSHRDYCGLAHGILEGLVAATDADATVTEDTCVHDDDADADEACTFRIALE
ncbi:heme NO-binding domain-containing protein [Halopiger djelfimassiliensis]|uniref:heme NO-binding domain-containing protein n=1 Tax=Halopiger djelfimassiliensis TaxID=1293047 RepID=UPI0006777C43|nr:heme NO-binding domain-containing protein [Halopiger djelfimassiliensis]